MKLFIVDLKMFLHSKVFMDSGTNDGESKINNKDKPVEGIMIHFSNDVCESLQESCQKSLQHVLTYSQMLCKHIEALE